MIDDIDKNIKILRLGLNIREKLGKIEKKKEGRK